METTITKNIIIINGIAAVFMFCSWLAQNMFLPDFVSAKTSISNNLQFVSSENNIALQWMLTFQRELRNSTHDPEIILNSARGYFNSVGSILEAVSASDPDSKVLNLHVSEFNKKKSMVDEAINNRDLSDIINHAMNLMQWFNSIDSDAKHAVEQKFAKVSQVESILTWIFRSTYILASFIFAYTWKRIYFDNYNINKNV